MARRSRSRSRLAVARERMYRALVFDSAEHVFARKGFDDATMQEIAAEAGISLRTLYATVAGKSELYDELLEVRGREFVEETSRGIEGGASALEALHLGVRAYVRFLVTHEDFLRIHLREGRAWGLPHDGVGERERAKGEALFADVVELGIRQGVFHPGDPQLMARIGMAVMQAHLSRVAEGIHGGATDALADEILTHLRRLLCKPEALPPLDSSAVASPRPPA